MDNMRDERDNVAVLTVKQDYMDASNAAAVKQDILQQLDGRTRAILDLSRVTFVEAPV